MYVRKETFIYFGKEKFWAEEPENVVNRIMILRHANYMIFDIWISESDAEPSTPLSQEE